MPRETPTQKLLRQYEAGFEIRIGGSTHTVTHDPRTDHDPKAWVSGRDDPAGAGTRYGPAELKAFDTTTSGSTKDQAVKALTQAHATAMPLWQAALNLDETEDNALWTFLDQLFEHTGWETPSKYRKSLQDGSAGFYKARSDAYIAAENAAKAAGADVVTARRVAQEAGIQAGIEWEKANETK